MTVEEIRVELDLTPTEFAKKLGVSKGHASDLRSGRRKPSPKVADTLARLAGRKSVFTHLMREKVGAA